MKVHLLSPQLHTLCWVFFLEFSGGMEQRRGAGGGIESPSLWDSASPEKRGDSSASSGPMPCKLSRLEVNSSPAALRTRQNGAQLGGGPLAHTGTALIQKYTCFYTFEV